MRRFAVPGAAVGIAGVVAAVLAGTSQVKAAPALTITLSPSANPVGQGQSINYAIKVTNGSSSTISNVSVSDSLSGVAGSGGGSGYAVTRSAGTCSQTASSRVSCTSTSLAAGQSITVTVAGTVTASAGSTLHNTASVSGTSGGQTMIAGTTNAALVQTPQGFTQSTVISGMHNPSVLAFAPNGDMWVGQQTGAIYIYHNGHLGSSPIITLNADGRTELGLLGIAFDPNFASNGFFYVSYVYLPTDITRVSRLHYNGSTASSETVLIQGNYVQQKWGFGPGETLKIGPDGKLYWSVGGDPYPWGNAQTLDNVYGKVHRMNLDGSAPSDNPFFNVPQPGVDKTIYAYGLRNPFRFTFLPTGGMMLSDTGSSYWEELNNIQKGSNYGWPITEGDCFSCGYANPAYSYGHLPNDGAESSILAYQQPQSGQVFPSLYNNVVFFGDYNRKDIEAVTFDPSYQTPTSDFVFSASAGTISDLEEGPDGNIYWSSIYSGTVYEISANKASFAPTAAASFTPNNGLPAVQFSSSGSSDPYGQPLSYSWDFGDGQTSTSANPSHVYGGNGIYTATLTVSNGSQSIKATATVMVGRTTTATISLPSNYNAGQTVNFSCSACVDSVDGNLPASAYTWQVDLISNGVAAPNWLHENQQPFYGPKSGVSSGSFTVPTDMSQNANTYYHVTLTVVNSAGVATVATADTKPNLTSWTATTNVSGMPFYVDGVWHNSTYTTQDVVGVQHVLMGQAEDSTGGQNYRMQGWNSGAGTLGEMTDSFTTTSSSATHTAEYDPAGALPAGWSNADIGGSLAGSGEYSSATSTGNTFYLDGAGADASGTTDQFHYTYETLNGDGSIVARVRYETNVNPWVKAGVMIKQSASSGAAFADAFVTPDVSSNTPNLNGINCVFPSNAPGAGCDAPLPAQTPAVGHGVGLQSKSGMTTITSTSTLAGYSEPNKWLKLTRSGSTFTAYFSVDGNSWKTIGSTSVSLSGPATIGLFVSSHDNRMTSSAAFDNVTVTGGSGGGGGNDFSISANPNSVTVTAGSGTSTTINTAVTSGSAQSVSLSASGFPSGASATFVPSTVTAGNSSTMTFTTASTTPAGSYPITVTGTGTSATHSTTVTLNVQGSGGGGGSCPAGWTCADIGSTTPAGTESFDSSTMTWSLAGAGSDIQGSADNFHYVWESVTGGTFVSADVNSQQNTNAWAKTGVMMRASSAANSAYYALFVTPGNGIVVSYRSTTGGTTTVMHSIPTGKVPVYLKITRSGNTFSGFTSSDGSTWTSTSGSSVTLSSMPATMLEGLAVTSHANGTLCNVTMTAVNLG